MHSSWVFSAITLVIACLSGSASGSRKPIDEVFQRKRWEAKDALAKRDLLCIEDDFLVSFETYEEDAGPFCSSYINLQKATTVSTTTTGTTIVSVTTTTLTANQVVTVPSGTVTTTITAAPAPAEVRKRQASAGIIPAQQIIAACTDAPSGLNLTLINDVSSACSCLQLPTSTVTETTITTTTRTLSGKYYKDATFFSTITSGEATVTVTVIPVASPLTTLTSPISATSSPSPGTLVRPVLPSSTLLLPPSMNTTVVSPGSISFIASSGIVTNVPSSRRTGIPPTGSPGSRGGSGDDGETASPSSTVPSISIPVSVSETVVPSSIIPPFSLNVTSVVPGSSGLPSTTSAAPSIVPVAPTNDTSNGYCPAANGTIYTTLGQFFIILCNTNYDGPSDQGLSVPDLATCIQDCAIANVGFSQSNCYAASFVPNNNIGADCYFRTANSSKLPEFDPKAISGLLINNTYNIPAANITALTSGVASSTGAPFTSSVSANVSTNPSLSPTNSLNVTFPTPSASAPSLIPSVSANITSVPSLFPTASTNIISFPPPTFSGFPTQSNQNRNFTETGGSSGLPSATANTSSSCPEATTVTESGVTETFTSILTVTVSAGI